MPEPQPSLSPAWGNYSGQKTQNFTIAKAALTVTAADKSVTYRDAVPAYSVAYSGFVNGETATALGGTLSYNCPYTTASNVGNYDIMPKGLTSTNYAITFVKGTLTVNRKALSAATVVNVTSSHIYTGAAQTPTFTVNDGVTLTSGTHFTASYTNNTNAGTATITITGTGNYIGTATQSFTIAKATLTVTADNKSIVYRAAAPSYTHAYSGFKGSDTAAAITGTPALSCTYAVGNNATTYPITVNVSGLSATNYSFTAANGTLTVNAKALTNAMLTVTNPGTYTYTGTQIQPTFTAIDGSAINASDYTVSYGANVSAGTGSITITGKGNYSSQATQSFTIAKRAITLTAGSASKEYDGTPLTNSTYTLTGTLASTESISSVTTTGTITDVGTANNVISSYTITRSAVDVTANYTVTPATGTLTITNPFSGGTGTSGSPFLIANKADLEKLRDKVNANANFSTGKYFSQTANIDLNNASWTAPIGNTDINQFKGAYNGNGWKISNLNISISSRSGLFGYVDGGTIKNLYVQGNVASNSDNLAGGIAASLTNSSISDCVFSGNVSGGGAGGIAGSATASSRIERCYVVYGSEVTTTNATGGAVGGIAATSSDAEIRSCYSLARVNGTTVLTGGIVGYAQSTIGTITNCAFIKTAALNDKLNVKGSGTTTTTNAVSFATVTDTFIIVPISGNPFAGDLLALLNTDQTGTPWLQTNAGVSWPVLNAISREYDGWDGTVPEGTSLGSAVDGYHRIKTPAQLAGFRDYLNHSSTNPLMNTYKFKLDANIDLNGIPWTPIGTNTYTFRTEFDGNGYTISGLNVISSEILSGLFGYTNAATIKNLSVKGNVSSTANFTGGIVGASGSVSTISNCVFSGSVSGATNVGGIVGAALGNATLGGDTIEYCYVADGSKVANTGNTVGGIVGGIQHGTKVKSCYSLAQVSGTNAGGVVGGITYNNTDRVSRCAFLKTGTFNAALNAVGVDTFANTIEYTGYFATATGALTSNGSADVSSTGSMPANLLALLNGDGQNKYRADSGGVNNGYPVLYAIK